jgi:ribosomal protein L20A (L18A)
MKIMNKEWRKISRTDNKEKVLSEIAGKYSLSDEDLDKLSKLL